MEENSEIKLIKKFCKEPTKKNFSFLDDKNKKFFKTAVDTFFKKGVKTKKIIRMRNFFNYLRGEILITDDLKYLDSKLINYLITIPNENNTITIDPQYLDIYEIIKDDNFNIENIDPENIDEVNLIIQDLGYFGNEKILENIMIKLSKYLKEKYIDRNSIEQFFEKYIPKISINDSKEIWENICKNPNMSEAFFDKYIPQGVVNWWYLCQNTNMSGDFFDKYILKGEFKMSWLNLCRNPNLPESFFEKYRHSGVLNWNSLFGNPNISQGFFEQYLQEEVKIDLESLFRNGNMPEAFFEKYITKKEDNLYWISHNPNLSEDFFEMLISKGYRITLSKVCEIPTRSEAFLEKYMFMFPINWEIISKNTNLSEAFFDLHITDINNFISNINYNYERKYHIKIVNIFFQNLFKNPNLSKEFFERHNFNRNNYYDYIYYYFGYTKKLSFSLLKKDIEKRIEKRGDISILCKNPNVSESFIEKYLELFDRDCWENLCKNTAISENFLQTHVPKKNMNIKYFSENSFRVNHNKEKIISKLKEKQIYIYDKLIYKYI